MPIDRIYFLFVRIRNWNIIVFPIMNKKNYIPHPHFMFKLVTQNS